MATNSRALKLTIHLILPLLLSVTATVVALLNVYDFKVNDWDYGIFSNLLWNFAHGNSWHMSLYEGEPRVFFLADHLVLLVPLFAPFFSLFPSVYTFSVLHSLAFAATFFLVPFFVREVWKQNGRTDYLPVALFLLLALSLSQGFGGAWRYQSHMTTLAMPFLLASLIALHRKATLWVIFFCLMTALAQERASVAVFGVGMYAWFITQNRRLGLTLSVFSALYFFLAVKVLIPFFTSGNGYLYSSFIQPFHDISKKTVFLFKFFSFWFFLPLLGKRALWAVCSAFPLLGLGLVSSREAMYGFGHQYQDLTSIFFLAASAFGLLYLAEAGWFRRLPRVFLALLACAALLLSYTASRKYVPARLLVKWSPKPAITRLNANLAEYSRLPPHIRIYASSGIGPRFALRKHRYVLTPEIASQVHGSSMIFIAPEQGMFPYSEQKDEIVARLLSNPSLTLTLRTSELLVFTSRDLLNGTVPTAQ